MSEHFIETSLLVSQRTDLSEAFGIKLLERKAWLGGGAEEWFVQLPVGP